MRNLQVLLLALLIASCSNSLPAEDSLRKGYAENKDTLVELLHMQMEDVRLVRIAPSFTRLDTDWSWPRKNIGISSDRWDRYRQLFRKANIADGIQLDGEYLFYSVASEGLAIGGTSRGFVYTKKSPPILVDHLRYCPRQEGVCFVKIEPDWYIFEWIT
jgi:hypothetical protein